MRIAPKSFHTFLSLMWLASLSLGGSLTSCASATNTENSTKTDPTAAGPENEIDPAEEHLLEQALRVRSWFETQEKLALDGTFFHAFAWDYLTQSPQEFDASSGGENTARIKNTLIAMENFLLNGDETSTCVHEHGFLPYANVTQDNAELCDSNEIEDRFQCARSIAILDTLSCTAIKVPEGQGQEPELCGKVQALYRATFWGQYNDDDYVSLVRAWEDNLYPACSALTPSDDFGNPDQIQSI